jgi:hypothetical protein
MLPSKQLTADLMCKDCKFLNNKQLLQPHLSVADKKKSKSSACETEEELLLWHWQLGHANHRWIQKLLTK